MEQNVVTIYKKIKIVEDLYLYKFKSIATNVEYDYVDNTITYEKNNKKFKIYDMEDPAFTVSDEKICFSDYMMTGMSDWTAEVTFPLETIKSMLKELEDKQYESLKDRLRVIIDVDSDIVNRIQNQLIAQENIEPEKIKKSLVKKETLEDVISELNSLIGLEEIKLEINKLKQYLIFRKNTKDSINLSEPNLNIVFSGNPGTGKTTVARLLARIYYLLGYAKSDKFVETTAQDFIAGYVGQTATKTRELINKNKNGVIFIDEAYVFQSNGQEFADEALVEIIKEMESKNTIFIFSGYTNEMKKFIDMNPGIKSRIGYNMEFKDYSVEELYEIFNLKIKKAKLIVTPKAKEKIIKIIEENKELEAFGNGRFIDNLFDKIIINHSFKINNFESVRKLKTITSDTIDEELIKSLKPKQKTKKIGY